MQADEEKGLRFLVRVVQDGPNAFSWEIRHMPGSQQVARSTRRFDTRIEAIVDAARASAPLAELGSEFLCGQVGCIR